MAWAGSLLGQPGALDPTFGAQGIVDFPIIGPNNENPINTLVEYPDGRILAVGETRLTLEPDIYMARLLEDGTFDQSFGTEGVKLLSIGGWSNYVSGVALLPDGRFLINGSADDTAMVARFLENGEVDPTFASNGVQWLGLPESPSRALSLERLADGRIMTLVNSNTTINLMRLLPDGGMDLTFSEDGKALVATQTSPYVSADMALDANGNVIIARDEPSNGDFTQVMVERWLSDGQFDGSFGVQGQTVLDFSLYSDKSWAVHVLPNGHVLVSGDTYTVDADGAFIVELDENGTLVPSFGTNGLFLFPWMGEFIGPLLRSMLIQENGSIILGGVISYSGIGTIATARILATGEFDMAYGIDGIAEIPIEDSEFDWISDMTISSSGSLLASGVRAVNGNARGVVLRIITGQEVGLEEHTLENRSPRIVPNPVAQEANVTFHLSTAGPISLDIIAADGRLVQSFDRYRGTVGMNSVRLQVPDEISDGLYILRGQGSSGSFETPMIVQRP